MRADIWKPRFIEALRNSGNVRASCQAAGITRRAVYKVRERSEEFARQWDEALEEAIDSLEAAAWRRARDGVTRHEPIMYQGQKVSEKVITEYSDALMTLLLKAHRPEKFRERVEHSGKVEVVTVEDARKAMADFLAKNPGVKPEDVAGIYAAQFKVDESELISEAVN
jgi:hypothetical protein